MIKNVSSYRVIYGDTDQMGVVYYANYLRWFEMGRTEFLRQVGATYASIESDGLRFPVTEVSCRYHRPARFDDVIRVETTLTSLGGASLFFGYKVYNENGGNFLAEGETKHACVDQNGRVTKLPPSLEKNMKSVVSPETT